MTHQNPNRVLIPLFAIATLFPSVSSGTALFSGILLTLAWGNPYASRTRPLAQKLLQLSIIGLGAGMNLSLVGRVGLEGLGYTVVGIFATLVLGTLLARLFQVDKTTGALVSVGTAICGGSAIAALSSAIRARHHEVSVSLATVFCLNAAGLFLFPAIGHWLQMEPARFGLWSALAIHDTSSVVGAAMQFGPEALSIATPVKLARALWIVPVTFGVGYFWKNPERADEPKAKAKRPWFILGFLAAAALVTWVPALVGAGHAVSEIAKRSLVLTLFLIGLGLTRESLKTVGVGPLLQGVVLWAVMASTTLFAIQSGWIH